ncbi:dihydrofolate reductase [Metabacillus litoralis]|uniref:dihydrofolate reductase n=1 Tax=Metabacillus litoralis TaxID=152268 RepID=UPI001CFD9BEA|nr:dihydrofolate reductase [Metabacillus litoralis]
MISLIVAMDEKHLIGKNNELPWRLPQDLAYFKRITMNHKIVMGRKTYESIGKPLPGRENIILTRDPSYQIEGCKILHSIDDILDLARNTDENVFVIGGAEIFKEVLPYSDRLYITHIHHEFEGDTYFPKLESSEWESVSTQHGVKDDRNPYEFDFVVYEKKSK